MNSHLLNLTKTNVFSYVTLVRLLSVQLKKSNFIKIRNTPIF